MPFHFIESNGNKKLIYTSILVEPKKLNIFGSDLALKIVKELASNPGCAMDLARKLNEHEQKIYYHLRRLENVGVIKQIRTEKRYAMTAKIYSLASPVIAAKLHDGGYEIRNEIVNELQTINQDLTNFFHPFIEDGKLNAKIIIGDTYSHGKYDTGSTEGPYVIDFIMMLGSMIKNPKFPIQKLDTEVSQDEIKNNIILIGNPRTNTIIDRMNNALPVYFEEKDIWGVVSKKTGKKYTDPRTGVIVKCDNPFNRNKKVMIIGGVGRRGVRATTLAITNNLKEIVKNINGDFSCIVCGYDKDGDKVIDSIKILECE